MIVVKIELWPYGYENKKKLLKEIRIANDGTGDNLIGNYSIRLIDGNKVIREGIIKGFRRASGVLKLLKLALGVIVK